MKIRSPMHIANKRAIKIVELQEELEKAKKIITEFIWPSDMAEEQRYEFEADAARVAGCSVPKRVFPSESEKSKNERNL